MTPFISGHPNKKVGLKVTRATLTFVRKTGRNKLGVGSAVGEVGGLRRKLLT